MSQKEKMIFKIKNFLKHSIVHKFFEAKSSTQANIKIVSEYVLHKLDKSPEHSVTLTKEDGLRYFKDMDLLRRLENGASQMYRSKIIKGFCHLYTGQEAVGVGLAAAMRPQDLCVTSYRAHVIAYLMGCTLEEILCELTGRVGGCARGKGGSMHMYSPRLFGGHGIVGAQIPIGTGLAFALKYQKSDGVCVTMYGDGAANQGQCYESFNMAKLLMVPVIFVCENNLYGLGTPLERASANPNFYNRCDYIPGIIVDGMDVLAVREATRFAIDFIHKGNGPIILECKTYRYFGHSLSDPGISYRKREEIEEVRKTDDCLKNIKMDLKESSLATDEEMKQIEQENKKLIEKALDISVKDKQPPFEELYTDVYVNATEELIRSVYPDRPYKHIRSNKFPIKTN